MRDVRHMTIAAVIAIAQAERDGEIRPISAADLGKRFAGNPRSLEMPLRRLRRAGVLESIHGAFGGYRLAWPPDVVTLGNIVDAIEPPGEDIKTTSDRAVILATVAMGRASDAARAVLYQTKLAELLAYIPAEAA